MLELLAALILGGACVVTSIVIISRLFGTKRQEPQALDEAPSATRRAAPPPARITPATSVTEGRVNLAGGRGFWFDVVGESNYQGTLRQVDGGRLEREEEVVVPCLVVPEPQNQYDRNALAVHVEGFGRVGYFQRDEASGRYLALGERLRAVGGVGTCDGKLTGGWDEDVSIGIRLSIMTPSEIETGTVRPPKEEGETERFKFTANDWSGRPFIVLDAAKRYGLNLVDEHLCQPELKRLAAGRNPIKDSMGFEGALVPDGDAVVVCAVGGLPVGRLSKSDVGRYSVVRDHLVRSGIVGVCKAWIITERDGLGVRLSLRGPAALEKALGLLSVPAPPAE